MQDVVYIEYRIKKDEDGRWCIKGYTMSAGEIQQQMATVYAKDTTALIEILLMLDGSQFVSPADDDDGPQSLEAALIA